VRSHPLETDCDEDVESWTELIVLLLVALVAGVACVIWDNAIDVCHFILRRARR
jgi:hypothetical protein